MNPKTIITVLAAAFAAVVIHQNLPDSIRRIVTPGY